MLRQLSQFVRSPFFGIGIKTALHRLLQTLPTFQTSWTSSNSQFIKISPLIAAFNISGSMPESSLSFPFFALKIAPNNSSEGSSSSSGLRGLCCALCSSSISNWLWRYKTLVKCLIHHSCCESSIVQTLPFSSFTRLDLAGIKPLLHLWMPQIHFHTTFLLYLAFSASTTLHSNQASLACLTDNLAMLQAVAYFSLSLSLALY